jgi:uncharacterized protein RhaS with RHS repeats
VISWHRFYDPETGRYITADPIGLAGGINLYAYVGGNPVNSVDPKGQAGLVLMDAYRLSSSGADKKNKGLWGGPGAGSYDEKCSLSGKVGDAMNDNPCIKKCCLDHDKCFRDYGCNQYSWITGKRTFMCHLCNIELSGCVLANIDCCESY